MTRGKRFKRLVRARAAVTGQSYTSALRHFQVKPKEGDRVSLTTNESDVRCSFCGKAQQEVAKLMAGPGVCICDECIRLGHAIVSGGDQPGSSAAGSRPVKPPFARFTERAAETAVEAQQAARELQHNFIGTEHLLLGVVAVAAGNLRDVLSSHNLVTATVRSRIQDIVGPSAGAPLAAPPFTPRAMRALELSGDLANQFGDEKVDVEHLLLGLLTEGHGLAAQLLQEAGVGIDDIPRPTAA